MAVGVVIFGSLLWFTMNPEKHPQWHDRGLLRLDDHRSTIA